MNQPYPTGTEASGEHPEDQPGPRTGLPRQARDLTTMSDWVRDILIQDGWTPPKKPKSTREAYIDVERPDLHEWQRRLLDAGLLKPFDAEHQLRRMRALIDVQDRITKAAAHVAGHHATAMWIDEAARYVPCLIEPVRCEPYMPEPVLTDPPAITDPAPGWWAAHLDYQCKETR